MITLRRTTARHHDQLGKQGSWLTFFRPDRTDPLADGFGVLEGLNEDRLPPGAGASRDLHCDADLVTYVREGALAFEDSTGRSGVIRAGEFERMTARRGVRYTGTNASSTDPVHVFQILLRASTTGARPDHDQRRFSAAERRAMQCVVASPDGQRGSLRLHEDTLMYSAILNPGQHLVYELPGRSAWLHVVHGELTVCDVVLSSGDGVGATGERAISFTARDDAEILLLVLGDQPPQSAAAHG